MPIYYKPDITYRLREIPTQELISNVTEPENIVPPQEVVEYDEELELNVDFLIHLCEQRLSQEEGFDEYRESAIEKYYCLNPLDTEQKQIINEFESEHQDTTRNLDEDTRIGDTSIEFYIYPRVLSLKRDIEMDIEEDLDLVDTSESYTMELLKSSVDKVEHYTSYLTRAEDIDFDSLLFHEDYDPVDMDQRETIDKINTTVDNLDTLETHLKDEYSQTIDEGNKERASKIRDELQHIGKDREDIMADVSYVSSLSYTMFRKSEETDSYLQKLGYLLLASPLDKLDDTVCCLLKVLIKQLDIKEEISETEIDIGQDFYERFHANIPLKQILETVSAIRTVLTIKLYASGDQLQKYSNKISNMLNAPVRQVINEMLRILLELRRKVTDRVEGLFSEIMYTDMDNPENILDCIHFEAFADFVMDGLEDIDDELRSRAMDFYKFVNQYTQRLVSDSIELAQNDKIRQIHYVLYKFEQALENVDDFVREMSEAGTLSGIDGLENLLTRFLHDIGLGTTYNSDTGQFEPVDLSGCIDTGQDMGNYFNYLPDNEEDINDVNLRDDANYQQFIEQNPDGINLQCREIKSAEDYQTDVDLQDYIN